MFATLESSYWEIGKIINSYCAESAKDPLSDLEILVTNSFFRHVENSENNSHILSNSPSKDPHVLRLNIFNYYIRYTDLLLKPGMPCPDLVTHHAELEFDEGLRLPLDFFPKKASNKEVTFLKNYETIEIVLVEQDVPFSLKLEERLLQKAQRNCLSDHLIAGLKFNLLEFLKEGRRTEQYCCLHFFYQLYEFNLAKDFSLNDWHLEYLTDAAALNQGEAILLLHEEGAALIGRHFAIYLGEELFISLLGIEGAVGITNLEALKITYLASKVARVSKKQLKRPLTSIS